MRLDQTGLEKKHGTDLKIDTDLKIEPARQRPAAGSTAVTCVSAAPTAAARHRRLQDLDPPGTTSSMKPIDASTLLPYRALTKMALAGAQPRSPTSPTSGSR